MMSNIVHCKPETVRIGMEVRVVFEEITEAIALRELPIRGKCADCENNDICWGCRAAAYHYLGDITASDPKCWLNPEAKETYFR